METRTNPWGPVILNSLISRNTLQYSIHARPATKRWMDVAVTFSWTTLCLQSVSGHTKKVQRVFVYSISLSLYYFVTSELDTKEVGKIILE